MPLGMLGLAVVLALSALATSMSAAAQPAQRPVRIGLLSGASATTGANPHLEAFRQGLRDQGYVEGRNATVDYRWAEGNFQRLPALAAELVRLRVDVIVASGQAAAVAKDVTRTIPIVFVGISDPIGLGLVASLARPGGNVTGPTYLGAELNPKRLELLKEAVPGVARVGVLGTPAHHLFQRSVKELEVTALSLKLELQVQEALLPGDVDAAIARMAQERADALIVLQGPMFFAERDRIADLAFRNRLPAIFELKEYVEVGGLMSYAPSFPDEFRRAAAYVGKILKGARPADLPVEAPTRFELVVNLKTAAALGLTIPQSVLVRADRLIR